MLTVEPRIEAARTEAPLQGLRCCMLSFSHFPEDPRVAREALTLARAGAEVDVVCLRGPRTTHHEKAGPLSIHRVGGFAGKSSRARYLWKYTVFAVVASLLVTYLWARRRHDVVHIHSPPEFLAFTALIPHLLGTPIILDLHEATPLLLAARFGLPEDSRLVRVARRVERLCAGWADQVFVVNDTLREAFHASNVAPGKVHVIPNSPDEDDIERWTKAGVEVRWGLTPETLLVVAGGLNRERDIETLVRSVGLLQENRSVGLLILGQGDTPYVERLLALIRSLRVEGSVVLGGLVPHRDALGLLALSAVGVVTLENNPHSRVALPIRLLEFAMLRKPLVVPRLPAIEAFVGEAAYLYEVGRPESLAAAIARALDENDRERLTAMARRFNAWRWPTVAQRLVDVYAQERRARPVIWRGEPAFT